MEKMYRNKTGIVLGLRRDEARKIAGGGAAMGEKYSLPLAGTDYDSGTPVPGVLQFFVGGPKGATAVTSISVTLLGKYSIDKMGRHVEEVGRSLGLELTHSEDNPRAYFDPLSEHRDLWVALGDGVVVVEVD
jgi:hypothetical protein